LDAIKSVLRPEGFQKFWDKCGKTGGSRFLAINAVTGGKVSALPKLIKDGNREKVIDKRLKG
jgi:hypothetical protein